ncbi:MAG: DUF3791 domain-containing protein [Bacteroidales bacterium]|nr:DUF3791 domain-containing protein [Bacteroidales bacterium]
MKEYILQRKIARIVAAIALKEGISQAQALLEFYGSKVYNTLVNQATELCLMSDAYIVDEYFLRKTAS